MATSKANPSKLSTYSSDGLELSNTLKTQASSVSESVSGLSSPYLTNLGTGHTDFKDLAGDWWHLDEFAGDVAQGFFKASGRADSDRPIPEGLVVTVDDGALGEQGRVGYADRDEAVWRAEAMAEELGRLKADGASPEEVQDFIHMADRGKYDSAFTVTFSNEVGVEGYADAAAVIRNAYADEGQIPEEGINAAAVLGTMLTTALDTRRGIQNVDLKDLSNEDLPDDERISEDFIKQLEGGYPDGWHPDPYRTDNGATDTDLSVVLSFTDPPTDVAVEIANSRMTPVMAGNYQWDRQMGAPNPWGQHGGTVTNYATMLGRNDDASALWLDHENEVIGKSNLELALSRWGDYDIDGGQALAGVVDNGLTHWNDEYRQPLMNETIDHIGGDQDEIRNQFLYDSLANGVDSNMDVISERIHGGWGDAEGERPPTILNTHDFLRETMGDGDAAHQIRSSMIDYAQEQINDAPESGAGRTQALTDVGRTLGVFSTADANATYGDEASAPKAWEDAAGDVDAIVGLFPGYGQANSVGEIVADTSVGDGVRAFAPDDEGAEQSRVDTLADSQHTILAMVNAAGSGDGGYMSDENDLTSGWTQTAIWDVDDDADGNQSLLRRD